MLDTGFEACFCPICAIGASNRFDLTQEGYVAPQSSTTAGSYAPYINALLSDYQWNTNSIFYTFPDQASDYTSGTRFGYGSTYGARDEATHFNSLPVALWAAADFAMSSVSGGQAQSHFALSSFTNLNAQRTDDHSEATHIRIAQSTASPTDNAGAWAYFPGTYSEAGDVWFTPPLENFAAGSWEWSTMIHELGHALGLEHPHDGSAIMPLDKDGMEYTVMSYRAITGGNLALTSEVWGYSQSWMMLDIAALQAKYGANFTPNNGEVVYSWRPDSGNTFVNGSVAIEPGANRIFATIWDGGGDVTYDLSAYTTRVQIDMRPGQYSIFNEAQLANLGNGKFASGNIYNGLLYNNDPRSLIKKVISGDGDDHITSNDANNIILSGRGHDTIILNGGNNQVRSGPGNDTITINGSGQNDVQAGSGNDIIQFSSPSASAVLRFSQGDGNDIISGFTLSANHTLDLSSFFSNINDVHAALSSSQPGISILTISPTQTISIDVSVEDLRSAAASDWLILSNSDTTPIFRFFNEQTGVHFLTASRQERDNIISTMPQFRDEGVAFTSSAKADEGISIFRFLNNDTGAHFYTASEAERDSIISNLPSFNFEGMAFYAFQDEAADRQAVYRFYNTDTGTHFYTASSQEKDNVIENLPTFSFEGVSYYVDVA